MDDRYLWDRGGPADPEVERLEGLLGRFRGPKRPFRISSDLPSPRPRPLRWMAAAAILLASAGVLWMARSQASRRWRVERVEGAPLVGAMRVAGAAKLAVGDRVETDAVSRARIGVGRIAEIAIGPGSRIRLVKAAATEQRLALDRGTISAKIWAPPRLFLVETPSALAVDLGCAYTLEVDADGTGLLRVETGWVSFERDGRESIVPAGAACATRPGHGPGLPYFEDAPPEFRRALKRYDFTDVGGEELTTILSTARRRDGLTLWHLLVRAEGPDRERVCERLMELVPPPPAVTRDGVLAGDERMLDLWRSELEGVPPLERKGGFSALWRRLWFRLAHT